MKCIFYTESILRFKIAIIRRDKFQSGQMSGCFFPFKYHEIGKPNICKLPSILTFAFCAIYSSPALFTFRVGEFRPDACFSSNFDLVSTWFMRDFRPKMNLAVSAPKLRLKAEV